MNGLPTEGKDRTCICLFTIEAKPFTRKNMPLTKGLLWKKGIKYQAIMTKNIFFGHFFRYFFIGNRQRPLRERVLGQKKIPA